MNYYSKENRYLLSQSHEKREKGLVMKKKIIIIKNLLSILGIIIFIAICVFPYPALFMANSLPKQPELSINEKKYFEKLKKEQSWNKIDRMYVNVDSLGEDIMIRNIPIDFSSKYRYGILFSTEDTACYYANCTFQSAVCFAKYIKDSICLNSQNLIGIGMAITYEDTIKDSRRGMSQYYKFLPQGDSLYLVPKTEYY